MVARSEGSEGTAPAVVSSICSVELPGTRVFLVPADLVYRAADCLAVNVVLHGTDDAAVGWTFAWDLLDRGGRAAAGEGDVRVAPAAAGLVEVLFAPPYGARIVLPARDVARFVDIVRPLAERDLPNVSSDLELELTAITEDW